MLWVRLLGLNFFYLKGKVVVLLAIDPGTRCSGYGVLKRGGKRTQLLDYGCWSMSGSKPLIDRIVSFNDFFVSKVEEHGITDMAIEVPFLGKSVSTYGKLSYLRGVLYLIAGQRSVTLREFTPRDVKKSVTGSGGASKEQVANLVVRFFPGIETNGLKDDTTDALAVGLCCLWDREPSTICRQSKLF